MSTFDSTSDDWSIQCIGPNEELEPSPDELDKMYQKLEAGEMLEISWKCPGRRLPTPMETADTEIADDSNAETTSRNLEFDFMDDVATPTIRVRAQNTTPKGSAKKKTANFASVIDAMKKNKRTN